MSWLRLLLLPTLGLALAALGCGAGSSPTTPNVILIVLDALRADHLGCYGYKRDTSPTLDRLAAGGARFEPVVVQSTATFPSVPSILTSRYGSEFYGAGWCVLEPAHLTLAEMLRAAGFATVGISSSPIVAAGGTVSFTCGGFAQGFDEYDDSEAEGGELNWQWRSPEAVVNAALDRLPRLRGKPFFLFLYIEDPHDRYDCPAPFATMFDPDYQGPEAVMRGDPGPYEQAALDGKPVPLAPRDVEHLKARYDGEIRYADAQVARLLERLQELALADDTLVIVTSDHGEEFLEHGGVKHGYALYEESLRAPLLMSWPGRIAAGTVVEQPLLQSVDIVPTILELARVPPPPGLVGESLVPLLHGSGTWPRQHALSETPYADAKALVTRDWKLIHRYETFVARPGLAPRYASGTELYDLRRDPAEKVNLAAERPEVVERLRAELLDLLPAVERERLDAGQGLVANPDALERLRALGYLR